MRDKMKVDGKNPIFWQGYLLKCSKPTGRGFWKKQYIVFQSSTLMLYSSKMNLQLSVRICEKLY